MLCQNCGKREANFHYTQIINGERKEIRLCTQCAKEMGLDDFELPMSMDFSNLFGDFFHQYEDASLLSDFLSPKELQCETCHMTYEDLLNTGKFGCANCYNTFRDKISPILKNLHGNNKHVGRIGSVSKEKIQFEESKEQTAKPSAQSSKLEQYQEDLKKAIKEERYEDAAKIRDEIKKMEEKKNESK